MEKLVSIISPCYNGEKYIHRLLDSINDQTYKNLEIVLVNDGSTDQTEEIIFSYKAKFESQGYRFLYIKQKNQGQSAAINQALKVFSGDYIAFVDSDDFLTPDAVEKKVAYMEEHPETGLLVNKIKLLDFDTLSYLGTMERIPPVKDDHFVADVILGTNVFYTPGGYFWRSSMFRDSMPESMQIVAPREIGQNFQLILPIAYKYPVGYLDDYLYYYLVRKGSHSRTKHTLDEYLHNWDVARQVLTSVACDIESNIYKRGHLQDLIDFRYYRESMDLCYNHKDRKRFEFFRKLWIHAQVGDSAVKGQWIKFRYLMWKNINAAKSFIVKYRSK